MSEDDVLTDSTETAYQAGYDAARAELEQARALLTVARQERDAEVTVRFAAIKERDAAQAEAVRLTRVVREQDAAAEQAARAAAVEHQGHVDAAALLAESLAEAERQRDDMTERRAAAIEKIPALRAKVAAGVALRPEIGAVDDEDAMALLIMAAADVHGLWEREKARTAELRAAMEAFASGSPDTNAAREIATILVRVFPPDGLPAPDACEHLAGDGGRCFECGAYLVEVVPSGYSLSDDEIDAVVRQVGLGWTDEMAVRPEQRAYARGVFDAMAEAMVRNGARPAGGGR